MEKKSYIVAIDLGSSNVAVAVGTKTCDGVEVESVVTKPVEGVNAGRIDNIELVGRAIAAAVTEASETLGIRITEAYAGISGQFVRCARHTDYVFTDDQVNGVSPNDVNRLFDRMRNVQAPDEEVIMERIPLNYMVDNNQEVQNPVGSFGRKLSSTFNFILCGRTPMQRLELALKRCGIRLLGIFPASQVTPEAVVTPDEKEEGVAVVDIGGGVTDVAVYYRNVLRYVATIPMGASAINRDIRSQSIPEKHVEKLKCVYGSAVAELAPEDKLIRVNGRTAREAKDILLRNLSTVIEARATDIVEFVMQELRDSGFVNKLAYGIVLTGGSAQLKDIDELFRRQTKMEVRTGLPVEGITEPSQQKVASPAYATVVGILLRGAREGACACLEQPSTPLRAAAAPAENSFRHETAAPGSRPDRTPAHSPQEREPVPSVREEAPDEDADGRATPLASEDTRPRRRSWGNLFKKAIENINTKFEKVGDDDEEI